MKATEIQQEDDIAKVHELLEDNRKMHGGRSGRPPSRKIQYLVILLTSVLCLDKSTADWSDLKCTQLVNEFNARVPGHIDKLPNHVKFTNTTPKQPDTLVSESLGPRKRGPPNNSQLTTTIEVDDSDSSSDDSDDSDSSSSSSSSYNNKAAVINNNKRKPSKQTTSQHKQKKTNNSKNKAPAATYGRTTRYTVGNVLNIICPDLTGYGDSKQNAALITHSGTLKTNLSEEQVTAFLSPFRRLIDDNWELAKLHGSCFTKARETANARVSEVNNVHFTQKFTRTAAILGGGTLSRFCTDGNGAHVIAYQGVADKDYEKRVVKLSDGRLAVLSLAPLHQDGRREGR